MNMGKLLTRWACKTVDWQVDQVSRLYVSLQEAKVVGGQGPMKCTIEGESLLRLYGSSDSFEQCCGV